MLNPIHNFFFLRGLFFICTFIVTPVYGDNLADQLPEIGTVGANTLTIREEKQLGSEFMRYVREKKTLLDDPILVGYLQGLADKLQSKQRETSQEITIFLVDDPSINAFTGPGGYIGILTGLILAARTEGELASVLAHEIAHVNQRHLVRDLEANSKMSLASMGAILAGLVLGGNNPQIGEAVIASSIAGSAQKQLTFSRYHEQEADRIGLELLVNAGFDPRDMVSFFEILQQKQRTMGSSAPEFLLTHPLTLSRIADARNRAEQYPKSFPGDNLTFQLMQARASTLTQKPGPNPFDAEKNSIELNRQAVQYYQGLVNWKGGKYAQARQILQQLLNEYPQRLLYHFSAAMIELEDNNPSQALKITQHALDLFPGSTPLIELHARVLLQLDKNREAANILKSALRQKPGQAHLYRTYAETLSKMGKISDAYRAQSEYEYLLGNIHQAIDHLQQALKSTNLAKYDRISIEARLEEMKSEALSREQNSKEKSQ